MFRQFLYTGILSLAVFGLTGCETMTNVKNKIAAIDLPSFSSDPSIEASEGGVVMASAEGCPQVAVVDDLKHLSQFETPATPSADTNISSVSITGMTASCAMTEKTVAVDIGLRFDGRLGPEAKSWNQESHSFAYPYFVAVTTPAGEILSKEVFAATIRYKNDEVAITQEESMKQVIPLREGVDISGYEILIGFQLTDDELNYNRTQAAQALSAPVSLEAPTPTEESEPVAAPSERSSALETPPASAELESTPVAEPVPAEEIAPTQDAVIAPSVEEAALPETIMETKPMPVAPQQQVIRIKADGSVESQGQ